MTPVEKEKMNKSAKMGGERRTDESTVLFQLPLWDGEV